MTTLSDASENTSRERRALGVASGAHVLHDGYTDLIYVMLPLWQAEFGLSYAAVGLLRGLYAGAMAGFQIPAGWLTRRFGAAAILGGGTMLAGLGYCLAGASLGLITLAAALVLGGIGASTQHPIASSVVAHAFAGARSMRALGTYNFTGDIGKMTMPALAAFMLTAMPWRPTLIVLGAVGLVAGIFFYRLTPSARQDDSGGHERGQAVGASPMSRGFLTLTGMGILDSATRMAFLTFLPFILLGKGAGLPAIGIALTLVFAGGAAGKLVCAFIGARIGVIGTVFLTETLTTVLVIALLPLPLEAAFVLLPLIGIALNGTSSVLYGSVPDLVAPAQRERAFAIFYTGTIGSGAVAPALYGLFGDLVGVQSAVILLALTVLITLPLAYLLRPALARQSPSAA
jgi:FSR family fosmidomycin resistance protein-like MFS transporter